jgi:hypothetical protein
MEKNRRKVLKEEYRQIKTYMGVFRITNNVNGKIFVDSCPNLKNKWLTIQTQLGMGLFANAQVQKDWKELGSEAFAFEVLEQKEADEVSDMRWELKQIVKPWLEKLQPFGDRGYNKEPK